MSEHDDLRVRMQKALENYTKNADTWAEEWASSDSEIAAVLDEFVARLEAAELVRLVMSWIVEEKPALVHSYVMGHYALEPIHDLPMFLREFPSVDLEGWMAKHAADMDRMAALAHSPEEAK